MTRIKRGYIARRRRTKIRLFASSFRGAHSRLTRTITQQKIRALVSAHRDRDRKKRDFRQSFIYSMTRIKRGYIARRRRTKIRLFASSFRGAHSRLTRTITQQKIRALVSAHRDRDRKKRDFRRLWITRINAVIRERGVSYSYSRLIHDLYKRQLLLNRKILAQIAILNRNCLYMISNEIIKEVDWKESTRII